MGAVTEINEDTQIQLFDLLKIISRLRKVKMKDVPIFFVKLLESICKVLDK